MWSNLGDICISQKMRRTLFASASPCRGLNKGVGGFWNVQNAPLVCALLYESECSRTFRVLRIIFIQECYFETFLAIRFLCERNCCYVIHGDIYPFFCPTFSFKSWCGKLIIFLTVAIYKIKTFVPLLSHNYLLKIMATLFFWTKYFSLWFSVCLHSGLP